MKKKDHKTNKKDENKKDYESSTTTISEDIQAKIEKSSEFLEKKRKLMKSRLEMSRCWVVIVFSYFVMRAALILYP